MTLIPIQLVVALLAIVCAFMFRRYYQCRKPEVLAALLARLYLLGVYFWVWIDHVPDLQRQNLIRLGITLWLTVESLNHLARTSAYRRFIERLIIAADVARSKIALHRR